MLANDLLSQYIPAVTDSDTIRVALESMSELGVSHLPYLRGSEYEGLVAKSDLGEISESDSTLAEESLSPIKVSVIDNQHIYEVIELITRYDLSILPVLSASNAYKGSITLRELVRSFSLLTGAGQPGAILVLSMAPQDYSPTILSRIIEENNAKILSLYAGPDPNGRELTVTIKVNTQETSSIMRTFDRYGYSVRSYFLANSQLDDFYRSRYEEFMKYMNI